MKKILIVTWIILIITLVGIIYISNQESVTDVTKDQTKVGVILNGDKNDHSWGESHYIALESIKEKLNLNIIYKTYVTPGKNSYNEIEGLIKQGCKIIICDSYDYGEQEYILSKEYPSIYFFHATGLDYGKNFTSYFGRMYQMRYLSGIVAGLQTKTNEIGYVAAMPISEVNRGINAFALGVQSVNPAAKVYVSFSNTWIEIEATTTATLKLLGNHPKIDVITMHTDSQRVLEIAEQKGIWSIGYNIDANSRYPKTWLTAPIWHWEKFYEPKLTECLKGKFKGGHYWFSENSGVIDLAPLSSNVEEGIQEKVLEAWSKLRENTFDVFYGPIWDNNGHLQVQAEENMADKIMLNNFDWYVKGVVVEN